MTNESINEHVFNFFKRMIYFEFDFTNKKKKNLYDFTKLSSFCETMIIH